MILVKKPFKSNRKLRKKLCVLISKKPPKFDKKIKKEIEDSINKKLFLMKKQRRKLIIYCFIKSEKPLKPS